MVLLLLALLLQMVHHPQMVQPRKRSMGLGFTTAPLISQTTSATIDGLRAKNMKRVTTARLKDLQKKTGHAMRLLRLALILEATNGTAKHTSTKTIPSTYGASEKLSGKIISTAKNGHMLTKMAKKNTDMTAFFQHLSTGLLILQLTPMAPSMLHTMMPMLLSHSLQNTKIGLPTVHPTTQHTSATGCIAMMTKVKKTVTSIERLAMTGPALLRLKKMSMVQLNLNVLTIKATRGNATHGRTRSMGPLTMNVKDKLSSMTLFTVNNGLGPMMMVRLIVEMTACCHHQLVQDLLLNLFLLLQYFLELDISRPLLPLLHTKIIWLSAIARRTGKTTNATGLSVTNTTAGSLSRRLSLETLLGTAKIGRTRARLERIASFHLLHHPSSCSN